MIPYIVAIFMIFTSPIIAKAIPIKNANHGIVALRISFLAMFLLFSLRAPSVGRDVSGYKEMYLVFSNATLQNFNRLYWTEIGYNFLELVFSRYLRCPWQLFLTITYGFTVFSYYHFFKRYSCDPVFSALIYFFLGYWIFDCSAIRNAISLAICLYAVPYTQKHGWKPFIKYLLLIVLAAQFHLSAYIFFLLYFVQRIRINRITVVFAVIIPVFVFLFRSRIMHFAIATFKPTTYDSGANVGGMSLFYFGMVAFSLLVYYQFLRVPEYLDISFKKGELMNTQILLPMKMLYVGALLLVFIGENTLVRVSQYGLVFSTLLVPNTLNRLNAISRVIVYMVLMTFLIVYFYIFKVRTNELDFLPYVFFWDA